MRKALPDKALGQMPSKTSRWPPAPPSAGSTRWCADGALGRRGGGAGADRHQRALETILGRQTLQQHRNGAGLIDLVGDRLLAEHQARGLAVDGDELRRVGPGLAHLCREAGREQGRIDAVHQQGQPAPAGDAMMIGQVGVQELEMGLAPVGDQIVVVAIGRSCRRRPKTAPPAAEV